MRSSSATSSSTGASSTRQMPRQLDTAGRAVDESFFSPRMTSGSLGASKASSSSPIPFSGLSRRFQIEEKEDTFSTPVRRRPPPVGSSPASISGSFGSLLEESSGANDASRCRRIRGLEELTDALPLDRHELRLASRVQALSPSASSTTTATTRRDRTNQRLHQGRIEEDTSRFFSPFRSSSTTPSRPRVMRSDIGIKNTKRSDLIADSDNTNSGFSMQQPSQDQEEHDDNNTEEQKGTGEQPAPVPQRSNTWHSSEDDSPQKSAKSRKSTESTLAKQSILATPIMVSSHRKKKQSVPTEPDDSDHDDDNNNINNDNNARHQMDADRSICSVDPQLRQDWYNFRQHVRKIFGQLDDLVDLHRDLFKSDPATGIPSLNRSLARQAEDSATETFDQLASLRAQFEQLSERFAGNSANGSNTLSHSRLRRGRHHHRDHQQQQQEDQDGDGEVSRPSPTLYKTTKSIMDRIKSQQQNDVDTDDDDDEQQAQQEDKSRTNDNKTLQQRLAALESQLHNRKETEDNEKYKQRIKRKEDQSEGSDDKDSSSERVTSKSSSMNRSFRARRDSVGSETTESLPSTGKSSRISSFAKSEELKGGARFARSSNESSSNSVFDDFDKRMEEIRSSLNSIAKTKKQNRSRLRQSKEPVNCYDDDKSAEKLSTERFRKIASQEVSSGSSPGTKSPHESERRLQELLQKLKQTNATFN